jgi:hypothetical protein
MNDATIHQPLTAFDLDDEPAYRAWRERKLEGYPEHIMDLIVEVRDPRDLSKAEHEAITQRCRKANMAIYVAPTGDDPDKDIPRRLGAQFGLRTLDRNMGADDDGITPLAVAEGRWRSGYIPYTDRPIHWHTDGYYNTLDNQIRALLLHCVRPAASGGENALLDHEIAYIHLRDADPDYIRALMAPDAMTIPANVVDGAEVRPARTGPVFSVAADGHLHMRYTARTRSIAWRGDPVTRAAARALEDLCESASPYLFRATLQPGQGLVSNNVLHDRAGFDDDEARPRLLYRLRYYERVGGT